MTVFSAILIGDESLAITCGTTLLDRGHRIRAFVTSDADAAAWAQARGLEVLSSPKELATQHEADWLLSIANLQLISEHVLSLGRQGAINFHDSLLPAYAGLNAPVWALLNGETACGVTWHLMEAGIDRGDILAQQVVPIAPGETAFSLNAKCYAAGVESFETLVRDMEAGSVSRTAQDFGARSYFARDKRPTGAGCLRFDQDAHRVAALVHALDFGGYWNPLTTAKLCLADAVYSVRAAEVFDDMSGPAGTVLDIDGETVTIACKTGAVKLSDLSHPTGAKLALSSLKIGDAVPARDDAQDTQWQTAVEAIAPHDAFWRAQAHQTHPARLSLAARPTPSPDWGAVPVATGNSALAACRIWAQISCDPDQGAGLGLRSETVAQAHQTAPALISPWVPLPAPEASQTKGELLSETHHMLDAAAAHGSFARDLFLRDPALVARAAPDIAFAHGPAPVEGTVLTLTPDTGTLHFDRVRIDPAFVKILADRLQAIATWLDTADNDTPLADCPRMAASEIDLIDQWNATGTAFDTRLTIPDAVMQQVAKTPDATAVVCDHDSVTYAQLNARMDAIAARLKGLGVAPGDHVGLHTRRSIDLVAGALAIMKTGAAYVPLDPDYPADRITHYIADSGTRVILSQQDIAGSLPGFSARVVVLEEITQTGDEVTCAADAAETAYLIYTSGSTGLPKGVMVTHRNVINFFNGMDADVDASLGTTWAAVTSMAFDISVLELFYTLARGFKVVLMGDGPRAAVSNGPIRLPGKKIDFNLFYWGNDDGIGRDKYKLLLDGAQFADAHGFNAIWTPERHFHAFGGPYPNPSVTGAAVAAVTRNLAVRAGSCVAPLHHTARIAEEWSVIDNLTNGRAGLAIASGWQPDDFVLRPENAPPDNKPAMYRAIDDLRKLWRGETVSFDKADGTPHAVLTQPRPVSSDLPIWVTTAGNPATWREAGKIGAHVLTHLLGQSIEEVETKIGIYHDALRGAGHDPDDFTVTLMLHTYLADDRETARAVARDPMKDYLRSAAGLIKQYAWAFPAFKRPAGVNNAFDMDLGGLGDDELEAILDFAFERYFEDSGLFGTVEDALARVEQVRRIGVTEVACLIDYGISVPQVLEGLRPLAQVLHAANAPSELAQEDVSLAAQLVRHNVSHLQCTPSMARIIAMDEDARLALSGVKQLFLGGEALPASLVQDLRRATAARITNMYGPTETTIWSSTQNVPETCLGTVPIGQPIANTTFHVHDAKGHPVPLGVPGELCIGGEGVTPGYWNRPETTADRFVTHAAGRVYRTGDLVCMRADGTPEFLGRNDTQVKIRGQRIELGEIEATLSDVSFVREAVVIPLTSEQGHTSLAAYFTANAPVDENRVRQHVSDRLPEIMVPSSFTLLGSFPLTPNRKVDRQALPDPRASRLVLRPVDTTDAPAEHGSTEDKVAAIWRRILGVDHVGRDDNFFALGGHSLLAVQAHRDIKAALSDTEVSITDIFRFPTLSGLITHLERGSTEEPASKPQTPDHTKTAVISKRRAMRANRSAKVG